MSSLLLDRLNPEQLAAVTLPHASALILAGAGSGKTRVLTTRIAWLLATGQASPLSILAVTFTNKAAKEMLTRLSALTPVNTRGMWVGTFHGLCNRMLRAHYRDAGMPQLFQIMDTQDQLALIKRVYKAHNVDDDRFPARALQALINGSKEEGLRPNQVEAFDDFSRRQVEHYALYEQACQREGVVDFPELLLRTYELLSRDDSLREHYRRRFSHILVDEFQDTNALQYKWLKLLAGSHAAIFAVGDDDQSIYAFRGANVANMQHFERDFSTAEVPVKLIKLEQNYRSHGHILDAANALIRHNQARLGRISGPPTRTANRCGRIPRLPIWTRPRSSSTWSRAWPRITCRPRRSPFSIAPMHSRAWSSTRYSTPRCPIGCMAECVSSSGLRSSTRLPISGSSPRPTMTAHF